MSVKNDYRAVFISDVHLGSRGCQAELLCDFLDTVKTDDLYLIGDFIDMWAMKRYSYWPDSHSEVVCRVLDMSREGTRVHYAIGNHDEDLRRFIEIGLTVGNVSIDNSFTHVGKKGKRYTVVHGDIFDSVISSKTGWFWMWAGSHLYDALLTCNTVINFFRKRLGMNYWSLADFMKRNLKKVVGYMTCFEEIAVTHAVTNNYNGVICGHIHNAKIMDYDGAVYMNDGDWVDCCSAIVETRDGEFKLIRYRR